MRPSGQLFDNDLVTYSARRQKGPLSNLIHRNNNRSKVNTLEYTEIRLGLATS